MKISWITIPYAIKAFCSKLGRLCTGQKLRVEPEEWKARLRVCSLCKHNEWPQCRICTCFIDSKVKWVDEYCPLMKWGEPMALRDWLTLSIGVVLLATITIFLTIFLIGKIS